MATHASDTRTGFLTILSADGSEVYGEFIDGSWRVEKSGDTTNNVFAGTASDGTSDTFRRLNAEGIDHLAYTFETGGGVYSGHAHLLMPEYSPTPGQAVIEIESTAPPEAQA